MSSGLTDLMRELERPRQRANATAVWRRSKVTAVSGRRVRTELTGSAWLGVPVWWTPAVGVTVDLLVQGNDAVVVSVTG